MDVSKIGDHSPPDHTKSWSSNTTAGEIDSDNESEYCRQAGFAIFDGRVAKSGLISSKLFKFFCNAKVKFIIGAMRTGGTYLYKELCEVYGQPWSSLSLGMTHDSIPTYNYLSCYHQPNSFLMLMFEMAQFFAWVKREITGEIVVQKRIAYAHALPVLDALLGKRAEYILTLRHPVPLGYSFARLEGQDPRHPEVKEPPGWYGLVTSRGRQMTKDQWHKLSYFNTTATHKIIDGVFFI